LKFSITSRKQEVDVFSEWLGNLKDKRAAAKIAVRIDRLSLGNFGDVKSLGSGVSELRIAEGPGYRIYFGMIGKQCVLLLCGGDKRQQAADIKRAITYWNDYLKRTIKP
jgi:putative addiction module killer protein